MVRLIFYVTDVGGLHTPIRAHVPPSPPKDDTIYRHKQSAPPGEREQTPNKPRKGEQTCDEPCRISDELNVTYSLRNNVALEAEQDRNNERKLQRTAHLTQQSSKERTSDATIRN